MNNLALMNTRNVGDMVIGKSPTNEQEANQLLNAMNQPEHKLADFINADLNIMNFFIQVVEVKNRNKKTEEDPDTVALPRVVLIDDRGYSYGCASKGVYNALEKLCAVYGNPNEWTAPMTCTVKQVNTNNGSMLTLNVKSANGNQAHF